MCSPQGTLGYKPKLTYPSRISVLIDQLNSVTEEYDLKNVSGSCKHQHSLSAREAFSTMPGLSRKYSNFVLVMGLVRTSTTWSCVGRYCNNTCLPLHHVSDVMVLDLNVFRFVMKHWILSELHTTQVITMNNGGIQHMSK
jgi:hypothetical protein